METSDKNLESELLQRIAKSSLDSIGKDFFRSTVKSLSEMLNLQGVMILEFNEIEERLKAFAFWFNNDYVENFEYHIKGTPCAAALESDSIYFIPDNVVDFFPEDKDLIDANAVCYIGLAIRDIDGKVLGHLAALNDTPVENIKDIKSVFEIVASRATLEMRRLKAESQLKDSEEKLNRLINGTQDFIIEFDESYYITQANAATLINLNFEMKKIQSVSVKDILTAEAFLKLENSVNSVNNISGNSQSEHIEGYLILKTFNEKEISCEATLSFYIHAKKKFYILICKNSNVKIEQENRIKYLNRKSEILQEEIKELYGFGEIIGNSPAIKRSFEMADQVAPYDTTVLITGETGTGKELFARAIHQKSSRADKTILNINCAALPQNLIESELFGHEKGAFTGAVTKRDGRFLLADHGTIFLDEIGELPLDLQSKLLRVIQEGEFQPVGSNKTIKVNVRLIAATNRDLEAEVKKGNFREDLYFRLNVFLIKIPPLRERDNDIIILAQHLLDKFSRKSGKKPIKLNQKDKERLLSYSWPGNIRELQNLMERGVITSFNEQLNIDSLLPQNISNESSNEKRSDPKVIMSLDSIKELERQSILNALEHCNWKISGPDGAARKLNIPASTLASKMKALSITRTN